MHLLITSAAAPLARSLAGILSEEHQIRLTEQAMVKSNYEFVLSHLGHDTSTNLLVRGIDAIVHVAQPLPGKSANEQIDYMTRNTYNLLTAAAEERVPRIIYLSSLELMAGYAENYLVDERWRPLPQPEPPTLTTYLGESVCREFAREHRLHVTVLRLAHVIGLAEDDSVPAAAWIDVHDVAAAITKALNVDGGFWSIYHLAADTPQSRFVIDKVRDELGFTSQHNRTTV
jgi:nucleoside-diphosphate-sugar epimerase